SDRLPARLGRPPAKILIFPYDWLETGRTIARKNRNTCMEKCCP
ncbi:Os08g0394000, partial [Oryza sativa Japonica Group]